jgi:transaldolase
MAVRLLETNYEETIMDFFLDTGIIEEIEEAVDLKIIDGVTTNPSLIAKTGKKQEDVITEIAKIVDGPISAEVISLKAHEMVQEAEPLAKINDNVVIKLPLTPDGLTACKILSEQEIKTNVTLCFSPNQALLAAKCGATYISPFIGRLDDNGHDGMALIGEIKAIYDNYCFQTKVLAASIRHATHVRDAALIGSDVATMPLKVLKSLYSHPLTDKGIETFLKDHAKANL